jgi:hypothetical protein
MVICYGIMIARENAANSVEFSVLSSYGICFFGLVNVVDDLKLQ